MHKRINKIAVLGSGVMGSSIAALMSNVGIETLLLDIVPKDLDAQDVKKGLSLQSTAFRNKLAQSALTNALRIKPAAFTAAENASLITVGNFEDDMPKIADVDWVIEVVVEKIDIKKMILKKMEAFRKPGTIVSTNTSGLSIEKIAEDLSDECRRHFLGTHFFNPPRYMKLIELIPCTRTSEEIVSFLADFCETRLGKGVVFAKDTPNFIANRLGIHNVIYAMKEMQADGYTFDEADALTGTALGRPKSATFRTLDMVGIDTVVHVARNVVDSVTDEAEKEEFTVPDFVNRMMDNGFLGDKKDGGFYKKLKTDEGSQRMTLNYLNLEYEPSGKAKFPVIDSIKQAGGDTGKRLKALIESQDKAGQFAWRVIKRLLLYSASKIPEIADDIVNIDRAMKWGFNHELGPFETWDVIGLKESVARMEKEGETIPENIIRMLNDGKDRFYLQKDGATLFYDFATGNYKELYVSPRILLLPALKERQRIIKSNAGASLIDMGDGVVCLEFHSPNNAIGEDIVNMINYGISEVENNFAGMVIGNHGANFCVGANLMLILLEAQNENWDVLDSMVRQFQGAAMRIKFSEKPVVAAPFRMTLGGGCEFCMAASRIRASSETYMGLVEVGVGVLPAGGGCKEMLLRSIENIPPLVPGLSPNGVQPDIIPFVTRAFETIAMARVSTSAQEAQGLGYMRMQDKISMNYDFLLSDAKAAVLALVGEGYTPPRKKDAIRVVGRTGMALIEALLHNMKEGKYISEYDAHIARKVANVITGGDVVRNTLVSEDYLLDLEREGFLSLCGEQKSQDRMRVMLQTNRPLRN
jgi:3-hydroxyacyl-CoA dehydrogenase